MIKKDKRKQIEDKLVLMKKAQQEGDNNKMIKLNKEINKLWMKAGNK